jgi:hypothetical protein
VFVRNAWVQRRHALVRNEELPEAGEELYADEDLYQLDDEDE